MKYDLYVKIFEDEKGEKDLKMIYTENFDWVKQRDKAQKSAHLLEFNIYLCLLLCSFTLMALCAFIVYPEILFLKALAIAFAITTLIYALTFNTVILIRYQKLKNWKIEFETTFEYLNQMAKIIEKRRTLNDIRRRSGRI